MGRRQEIEVVWVNEPSQEVIYRAQLRLLGWTEEEIRRAVEEWRQAATSTGEEEEGEGEE
jgi:hypothetical protein